VTEKKSLKRRVRARMTKTGERYAAARRQVLSKPVTKAEPPPSTTLDDELVVARTGRAWADWFELLTDWGAGERSHAEIAKYLNVELGVAAWWSQSITVEFERAIGRRRVGQRADGTFVATASKTIAVPAEAAFEAFVDEARRAAWLTDLPLRLRGTRPFRSLRFDWGSGPSRVVVTIDAKGEARCLVTLEHQRLDDADDVRERGAFWRDRLGRLQRLLEP
jgi:uncharacterized protein YndB with AHSA1/START domain